ncbi:ribosomal RNA small subunit methyltransferase A [bacterium]|nr:MAG: ribosomal RNA small subunit methyltransferase A [bacterium]
MIQAKKSLGQNFLKDENIIGKIVNSLFATEDDLVIEIGPGTGALTRHLYKRYPNFVAIELDERAEEVLKLEMPDLEIIHSDVLKVDFKSLRKKENQRIFVIGNIPYYITSPILFHVFDQAVEITQSVLMMQLEVAQRLAADKRTKDYGILTVQTQFFSQADFLFKVPRQVFHPVPNVDSAVVSFKMNQGLNAAIVPGFKKVVRMAFNQRRKKLSNALKGLGVELSPAEQFLDKRAEELTVDDFIELTRLLGFN